MKWQFAILNNRTSVETIIREPVGWDGNTASIKRDPDMHGMFFENQGDKFEFYNDAERILKAEYDVYKHQADLTLICRQDCGNGYEEFDRAKFLMLKYDHSCGAKGCYVKCPLESIGEVMDFKNRLDQKVNLETVKGFDETTDLVPYAALPATINLPSKGVFIQNKATTKADLTEEFVGGLNAGDLGSFNRIQLEFGLPDEQISEIGSFYFNPTHLQDLTSDNGVGYRFAHTAAGTFVSGRLNPLNLSPVINYFDGSPNFGDISNPVNVDIELIGEIELFNTYIGTTVLYFLRLPERLDRTDNGALEDDYEYLSEYPIYAPASDAFPADYKHNGDVLPFSWNYTTPLTINKGDRFYLFIAFDEIKQDPEITAVTGGDPAFTMKLEADSHFIIDNLSHVASSDAKVFLINETISRVAEAISNDKVRAYSEYYGRTDSEPYSHAEDGCGGLRCLTDGIRIRQQEERTPGNKSVFSLSLEDLFLGLNPIDNIGMGLEPDTERPGFNRLRVEPWHYFYNDDVILNCLKVNTINRKCYEKEIYSTMNIGYAKWEAEEYNGIDEFLTSRIYRTMLNMQKKELKLLTAFIASGYAIEVTRRKGIDTKDWRYDKDSFIICLKRDDGLKVELGNIDMPANIIDPPTIYNFRISPVRNALRWMDSILRSYANFDNNAKLVFTDGKGNYFAEGKMTAANCRLEDDVIAENAMLNKQVFDDPAQAAPFLTAERIVFDYPLNSKQYRLLKSNPYGKIYFENDCESGYGYIDEVKYTPEKGMANFNLIPVATWL